jgi:hypothetical protein
MDANLMRPERRNHRPMKKKGAQGLLLTANLRVGTAKK